MHAFLKRAVSRDVQRNKFSPWLSGTWLLDFARPPASKRGAHREAGTVQREVARRQAELYLRVDPAEKLSILASGTPPQIRRARSRVCPIGSSRCSRVRGEHLQKITRQS